MMLDEGQLMLWMICFIHYSFRPFLIYIWDLQIHHTRMVWLFRRKIHLML